jgi:hypothetical protein
MYVNLLLNPEGDLWFSDKSAETLEAQMSVRMREVGKYWSFRMYKSIILF